MLAFSQVSEGVATESEIAKNVVVDNPTVTDLYYAADSMGLPSFVFFWWAL